jgi:ATP-dependent Lhr-like helicase
MIECAFPPEDDLSVFPKASPLFPVGDPARFGVGEASDAAANSDENALARFSGISRLILNLLQERGAETLPFILKAVKQPTATVWQALEELMLSGLITNDSFGPIRYLLRTRPQSRVGARGVLQPALMAQMGRWSLLPPLAEEKTTLVRGLLSRYGIVCREIAQAEGISWGTVYPIFDTLENIGQVQRGYFIKGLSGIQYALPQALTELNTLSHQHCRYWSLHWSDPANPLRFITDWPETAEKMRINGDFLVFTEGRPLLVASGRRLRLNTLEALSPAALQKALEALMVVLYPAYPDEKIIVSSFNGEAASKSQAKEALSQLGFEEGYQVMTLWPSDR